MKLTSQPTTLELLTPCFAGGASPTESAEVRVPTLRGQLRVWLRVLFPGQAMDDLIFGQAQRAPARASRVSLRLVSEESRKVSQNLLDYTGERDERDAMGKPESYFLWPLRPQPGSEQKRGVLLPLKADRNACFTFAMTWFPPFASEEPALRPKLDAAVRAFSLLGALGTRATRGYGSVWGPDDQFADVESLRGALSFLPPNVQVRLLKPEFLTGRDALAGAARWMRSLRIGSANFGTPSQWGENDHDVADPAQGQSHNALVYRHALGMPLAQRFRRGNETTTVSAKYSPSDPTGDNGPTTDRYPSPVRIKVCRLAGKYRFLVVILRGLLLPEHTKIRLSAKGGYEREALLSHGLVEHIAAQGEAAH